MTASPVFSQSAMVSEWSDVTRTKGPYPGPGDGYCIGMKYCPGGVGSSGAPMPAGKSKICAPFSNTCRCIVVRLTTMAYGVLDSVTSLWRTQIVDPLGRWARRT